ncbi:MAG: arginase family protein [Nanobdellota archaeon]
MQPIIIYAPVTAGWQYKGIQREPFLKGPVDIPTELPSVDIRDFTQTDVITHQTYEHFEQFYIRLFGSGSFPITIGGDHAISIPATTACNKVFPTLQNIRLDRDLDMGIAGIKVNGTFMQENCQNNNFDEAGLGYILTKHHRIQNTHIGSPIDKEYEGPFWKETLADHIARSMRNRDDVAFITQPEYITTLSPGSPVYLSIDVDCYRGVNAKTLGLTPLEGWMEYSHVQECIDKAFQSGLKGLDICEITNIEAHKAQKYAKDTLEMINSYVA